MLNVAAAEGLVKITLGEETCVLTWIDAIEVAYRISIGAYSAAADIDVDPSTMFEVQMKFFKQLMGE